MSTNVVKILDFAFFVQLENGTEEVLLEKDLRKRGCDALVDEFVKQKGRRSVSIENKENEDKEYTVEKLMKKRKLKGVVQYLVKWEDYTDPTWEPETNLPETLIRDFEMKSSKTPKVSVDRSKDCQDTDENEVEKDCPDIGENEVEKILGASPDTESLLLLVKMKGSDDVKLVPSDVVYKLCPLLVLKFFEQRIIWNKVKIC